MNGNRLYVLQKRITQGGVVNECMHRLFAELDPVGQKMRFHLRAGISFTGTVHTLHRDADGRIAVIQLVPGHKATGDYMFLNRSEEHTSELQSRENLVCRLLLEKKKI